jgi:hypothetical protein
MLQRMIRASANNSAEFLVPLRGVAIEGTAPDGIVAAALAANTKVEADGGGNGGLPPTS